MKKWVLGIIVAAVLMVLIILAILNYATPHESPHPRIYCLENYANIQSISCTKTSGGYFIQTKLDYFGSYNSSENISRVAFVLKETGIVKFLNFSSSDYSFTITDLEAIGLKNIGVALRIKDIQCDISDTKNITCS